MLLTKWLKMLRQREARPSRPGSVRQGATRIVHLERLERRLLLSGIAIQFDYRFDTANFFDTQAKKDTLNQAANVFTSRISDNLTAIQPSGGNTWDAVFEDPASASPASLTNLVVPADTLIVFVGGRSLSGELAMSAPGGLSAAGDNAWLDTVNVRGQTGALAPTPTDFGPWGGSLWFNSAADWFVSSSVNGLGASQTDFLSVATHELGHVLGFGTAPSFAALVAGSVFTGTQSVAEYGGSVPLESDLGHWADNVTFDGGVEAAMDPTLAIGTRKEFTELDFAALHDLGWNVSPATPGFTVVAGTGLQTSEAGGTATFTVVLNSRPASGVTIPLTSSNTAEGTVSSASLTFTTANWRLPQTVTVTGVNDFVQDGDQSYRVVMGPAISADSNYSGLALADVALTNLDDDVAGFTVSPTSGLVTTEAGGTATFTVLLTSQPTAEVSIALTSSNTAEGRVSPGLLTFTAADWNVPKLVTVTGVNDFVQDGNRPYTIVLAAAVSDDAIYRGIKPADVSVLNNDDDQAGITVSPTAGLATTESGGAAGFSIVLRSQPVANVRIDVSSSNTAEGTIAPSFVNFTPLTWNLPQMIVVTGVPDFRVDGNQQFSVVTSAAVSTDPLYSGVNPPDVSLVNIDVDEARVVVSPTFGLVTSEAGGTATFSVVLASIPTGNVIVPLSSSNTAEGTISVSSLTFTPATWNQAQVVTVTGVDDRHVDGDKSYTIITGLVVSSDSNYNGLNPPDVVVTNLDNDLAGVTVTPVSGLSTTEAGGTATFTVVLEAPPSSPVAISLSSTNTAEGTVSPAILSFTPANWSQPQTVTITGVDDFVQDGNKPYAILVGAAASNDVNYNGYKPADVSVINIDDDVAGIRVTSPLFPETTEGGATATLSVVLTSQPTADVTIPVRSSDTNEGTVSVASVTFTPSNWNQPRTVIVTGVDDFVQDGNRTYTILFGPAVSSDGNYSGKQPPAVTVTNDDNDTAGIRLTLGTQFDLVTDEAGRTASFGVFLASQPTASVTLSLQSSNTAEGVVSPASLVFTLSNWNVVQTVTLTGVNDFVADGTQAYTVTIAPVAGGDALYNSQTPLVLLAFNLDDEKAGITAASASGPLITQAGQSTTFTVVLSSQPSADVTIGLSTSDPTMGTVSPSSLTFTAANWNQPQTVTVTGVAGPIIGNSTTYNVLFSIAGTSDSVYSTATLPPITVTNGDRIPASSVTRMFRAYNPNADYHFFTISDLEFNNAVIHGYSNETSGRPGYDVLLASRNGAVPIHRMYNIHTGRHYYTVSDAERNMLVSIGWKYEKDEGFMYMTPAAGTTEVFRLYNKNSGVHLYTENVAVKNAILTQFAGTWVQHSSLGYAFLDGYGGTSSASASAAAQTLQAVAAEAYVAAAAPIESVVPQIAVASLVLPVATAASSGGVAAPVSASQIVLTSDDVPPPASVPAMPDDHPAGARLPEHTPDAASPGTVSIHGPESTAVDDALFAHLAGDPVAPAAIDAVFASLTRLSPEAF